MRVLVTGGTGFIGRHLITHLLHQTNDEVVLLLREGYSDARLVPQDLAALRQEFTSRVSAVYADLRNFQLTVRAVRQAEAEAVVHLAAVGATDPFLGVETAVRHNLNGTVNLLRACFEKSHHTQRVLVARTPGELSAMNVYAASKAASWAFCQMYWRTQGWPIAGAMIFQAYGPGQPEQTLVASAVRAALTGQDFPMTNGRQARDWVYVTDVAAGLSAGLEQPIPSGVTLDLGTGRLTAVVDVVRQIYALAGKGGQPLPGVLPNRPGEVAEQVADTARTKALVGWETAVTLQEGLAQTLASWQHLPHLQ